MAALAVVYVLTEGGVVSGVYARLEDAKAAAESAPEASWSALPSVKGSWPMWWRGTRPAAVIEAFEVQP